MWGKRRRISAREVEAHREVYADINNLVGELDNLQNSISREYADEVKIKKLASEVIEQSDDLSKRAENITKLVRASRLEVKELAELEGKARILVEDIKKLRNNPISEVNQLHREREILKMNKRVIDRKEKTLLEVLDELRKAVIEMDREHASMIKTAGELGKYMGQVTHLTHSATKKLQAALGMVLNLEKVTGLISSLDKSLNTAGELTKRKTLNTRR